MIHVQNLTLCYGQQSVLRGCTLHVPPARCIALMGPSGCGKTTLLQVIAGLLPPDDGSVTVNGKVSCVFQEPSLFPWLSAEENINVVLTDRAASLPEARRYLAQAGIDDCAAKYPHQLSGGQKQRVAIARALAYGGDILLLDEPFRGLDDASRSQIVHLICRCWVGKTIVLATHDPREAEALGCRILTFADGRFA